MYQSQYRALPFITETCKSILSSYIWGNQHKKMSAKDFCRVNNDFLPSLKTAQKNPTFSLMHSHQCGFLLFRGFACQINFLLVLSWISVFTLIIGCLWSIRACMFVCMSWLTKPRPNKKAFYIQPITCRSLRPMIFCNASMDRYGRMGCFWKLKDSIFCVFAYFNKGKPSEKFYRCFEAREFGCYHHPFPSLHHIFEGI